MVSSSACGLTGIAAIVATAVSLHTVTSLFGARTTSVLTNSSTAGGLGDFVFEAIVFGVVFVFLAIALAWGAISAVTGVSIGTAVTANIITAVLLLIAVINVHPLLLLLLAAPAVAVIALLSPSSKDYVHRRAG